MVTMAPVEFGGSSASLFEMTQQAAEVCQRFEWQLIRGAGEGMASKTQPDEAGKVRPAGGNVAV